LLVQLFTKHKMKVCVSDQTTTASSFEPDVFGPVKILHQLIV